MGSKKRPDIQEDINRILSDFDTFLDNVFESPVSSPGSELTESLTQVEQKLASKSRRRLTSDPSPVDEKVEIANNFKLAKNFFNRAASDESITTKRTKVSPIPPSFKRDSKWDYNSTRENVSSSKLSALPKESSEIYRSELKSVDEFIKNAENLVNIQTNLSRDTCPRVITNEEKVPKVTYKTKTVNHPFPKIKEKCDPQSIAVEKSSNFISNSVEDRDNEIIETVEKPGIIIAKFESIADNLSSKSVKNSGMVPAKVQETITSDISKTIEKPSCITKHVTKSDVEAFSIEKPVKIASFERNADSVIVKSSKYVPNSGMVPAKVQETTISEIPKTFEKPICITKHDIKADVEVSSVEKPVKSIAGFERNYDSVGIKSVFNKSDDFSEFQEETDNEIVSTVERPSNIIAKFESKFGNNVSKPVEKQNEVAKFQRNTDVKVKIAEKTLVHQKLNKELSERSVKPSDDLLKVSKNTDNEILKTVEKSGNIVITFKRNPNYDIEKRENVTKLQAETNTEIVDTVEKTRNVIAKFEMKNDKDIGVKPQEEIVKAETEVVKTTQKTCDVVIKDEQIINYTHNKKLEFFKDVIENNEKPEHMVTKSLDKSDGTCPNQNIHTYNNERAEYDSNILPKREENTDKISALQKLLLNPCTSKSWEILNKPKPSKPAHKITKDEISAPTLTESSTSGSKLNKDKMLTDYFKPTQKQAKELFFLSMLSNDSEPKNKLTKDDISSPILIHSSMDSCSLQPNIGHKSLAVTSSSSSEAKECPQTLEKSSSIGSGNISEPEGTSSSKFKPKDRQHLVIDNKQIVNFDSLIKEFNTSNPCSDDPTTQGNSSSHTSPQRAVSMFGTRNAHATVGTEVNKHRSESTRTIGSKSSVVMSQRSGNEGNSNVDRAFETSPSKVTPSSSTVSHSSSITKSQSLKIGTKKECVPKEGCLTVEEEISLANYLHDLLSSHSAKMAAGIMSAEHRGTKALELWTRRATEGYPGVYVSNMTTAWRDGLAFCALIHHFRPELIDFKSLKASKILENNALAFRVAEQHLGIPALLDAEDMVQTEVPDRLSILTYVSQFYQAFSALGLIGPGGRRSPLAKNNTKNVANSAPAAPTTPAKPAPPPGVISPKAKAISQPPATLQTKTETGFKTDKDNLDIIGNYKPEIFC